MSFSFLGLMGSATGSGLSLTVPVTTSFPAFTATNGVAALLFIEYEPGLTAGEQIFVTDDALFADSTVFGARWSPWNNADFLALVGSTTDPPIAGPVNPWADDEALSSSGPPIQAPTSSPTGYYYALLCPIYASPSNITITFPSTPKSSITAYVYGVEGLVVAPSDENTGSFVQTSFTWFTFANPWPESITQTMNPGFFWQLVTHAPTSATTLDIVTDGSSTTEAVISLQSGLAEGALTWRDIVATVTTVDIIWDGEGTTAESNDAEIGDPTVPIPDPLMITITASGTFHGSFTRWVVTIIDSAGIPSNSTTHLTRAFWRILEAPGGGGGLDGNWSLHAYDLTSSGRYVVQNPINAGYYIDVPTGSTWTLRGVMYDGFFSNEVDVTLGAGIGSIGALFLSDGSVWHNVVQTGQLYLSDGVTWRPVVPTGTLYLTDGETWTAVA